MELFKLYLLLVILILFIVVSFAYLYTNINNTKTTIFNLQEDIKALYNIGDEIESHKSHEFDLQNIFNFADQDNHIHLDDTDDEDNGESSKIHEIDEVEDEDRPHGKSKAN